MDHLSESAPQIRQSPEPTDLNEPKSRIPLIVFFVLSVLLIVGVVYATQFSPAHVTPQTLSLSQSQQPISPPSLDSSSSAPTKEPIHVVELPQLTLESIFSRDPRVAVDTTGTALDQSKITTLFATGDVIPSREVHRKMVLANDFKFPLARVQEYLKSSDLTLIDLELPILKSGCPIYREGFTFCTDARFADALVDSDIDVVNLPNNHIGNFGTNGIQETKDVLDEHELTWDGFGTRATKRVNGTTFGFLGYNAVGAPVDRAAVAQEITEARKDVDVLVVSVHWGREYVSVPASAAGIAPDDPRELGRLMIDAGADLIIGNHPHWVQGVELYKDKLITYAHGNFVFDQTWSKETQEGVVGEYVFYEHTLISVQYKPLIVDKTYAPRMLSETVGRYIVDRMEQSSQEMERDAETYASKR